ncbi:MAG: relaxase NikB, partial [Sulfurimonas sp.]
MISRVTMRKSGLAEYLEKGKRADSKHSRLEKDHVIPLYGSLDVLRKAEEHCLRTKKWNYNYEHITISFSPQDEEVLDSMTPAAQNATLQDIAKMMVRHRTYGYDFDNEVIAYAECHAPKIQEETNIRTGEIQSRKKHIHIGISYLNPLSDTKLRTTFFNSSYISDTIDRYIAKKHGLHDASPTEEKTEETKENPRDETHIALERKAIKALLAPVKNQEELLQILEEKKITYKVAKGKQGTYIKLINPHGKNINLRGKDFKHLERFGSTVLSPLEKQQHLKELKNKSLFELEAILESYYKEHRLPR